MAFAATHPDRTREGHFIASGRVAGPRPVVRPVGVSLAGAGAVLVGIWGGIAGYVGPYFGYRPTSATAWDWNTQNGLLHLAPGALAVLAGLLLLSVGPARGGGRRAALVLPAVLLAVAGAWFVVGPAAWPVFESGPAFAPVLGAGTSLLDRAGSSLAPGLALVLLAGMALKASLVRPPAAPAPGPVDLAEPPAGKPAEAQAAWPDVARPGQG